MYDRVGWLFLVRLVTTVWTNDWLSDSVFKHIQLLSQTYTDCPTTTAYCESQPQTTQSTTCAKQCCLDCYSDTKVITHQATTMAAGPTADHVKVGRSDV